MTLQIGQSRVEVSIPFSQIETRCNSLALQAALSKGHLLSHFILTLNFFSEFYELFVQLKFIRNSKCGPMVPTTALTINLGKTIPCVPSALWYDPRG